MSSHPDSSHSKFHALLHDQIRHEFNAEHQYIAIAVWFDNADLPVLAKHFYAQAIEERNHAMMIVQYFLDRDMSVELSGVDGARSQFENAREPIQLALQQEKTVTEQIIQLASTAREEGDYLGEQFMQYFPEGTGRRGGADDHAAHRRGSGRVESVRSRVFRLSRDERSERCLGGALGGRRKHLTRDET